MNIDRRWILVLSAIIALIFFIFIRGMTRENKKIEGPALHQNKATTEDVTLNYAIPANAVPTVEEIEESTKRDLQKREETAELTEYAKAKAEKARLLEDISQGASAPAAVTDETTPKENATVTIPTRQPPKLPTHEERQSMKARGIIIH